MTQLQNVYLTFQMILKYNLWKKIKDTDILKVKTDFIRVAGMKMFLPPKGDMTEKV